MLAHGLGAVHSLKPFINIYLGYTQYQEVQWIWLIFATSNISASFFKLLITQNIVCNFTPFDLHEYILNVAEELYDLCLFVKKKSKTE